MKNDKSDNRSLGIEEDVEGMVIEENVAEGKGWDGGNRDPRLLCMGASCGRSGWWTGRCNSCGDGLPKITGACGVRKIVKKLHQA